MAEPFPAEPARLVRPGGRRTWSSPEQAAQEPVYSSAGDWYPRPRIHRWLPELRERFVAELRRLEKRREQQRARGR